MYIERKFYTTAFRSPALKVEFYNVNTKNEEKTKIVSIENSNKYHIIYCLSDYFTCSLRDEIFNLKKGSIIILRPDEKVNIYSNAALHNIETEFFIKKTPMHLLAIELSDKLFENDIDVNSFFRSFNERDRYKYNIYFEENFFPSNLFHNCALQLGNYIKNNLDIFQFKSLISTMITALNLNYDKNHDYSPTKYSREYEVKIYDYISRNFNKNISIKHLCEKFFVSKVYINKVTNKFYGMNFNEMIQTLRIWESINLMKSSADLNEISTLCGYKNYTTFYRNFVNYFGETPTKKQKEIKELIKNKNYSKLKEIPKEMYKKTDSN